MSTLAEVRLWGKTIGAVSLQDVLGWSYPWRRVITFLAPNFYGNPSHHSLLDLFTWQSRPVTVNAYGDPIAKIDWGIKNYVEAGSYAGILPLVLLARNTTRVART